MNQPTRQKVIGYDQPCSLSEGKLSDFGS